MKKEWDEMDDLFQSELSDLNVPVDSEMDEAVMNRIEFVDKKKKKKRFFLFFILFIGISFGGILLLLSQSKNNEPLYAEKNINLSKDEKIINQNSQSNNTKQTNNDTEIPKTTHLNNSELINNNSQENKNKVKQQNKKNLNTTNSSNPTSNNQSAHKNGNDFSDNNPTSENNFEGNKIETDLTEQNTKDDDSIRLSQDSLTNEVVEIIEDDDIIEILEPSILIDTNAISSIENPERNENFPNNSIAIGFRYSYLSNKQIEWISNNEEKVTDRNNGTELFLNYKRNVFKNITFSAGFQFESTSDTWENKRFYDTLIYIPDPFDTSSFISIIQTVELNSSGYQFIRNFGVPLSIGYRIPIKNSFLIAFGLQSNIGYSFVSETIIYNESVFVNQKNKKRSLFFQPGFQLGLTYKYRNFGFELSGSMSRLNFRDVQLLNTKVNRINYNFGGGLVYFF